MYLVFDTETTGRPRRDDAPLTDFDNWPRVVQLAWQLHADDGSLIHAKDFVIRPDGYDIPFNAAQVHGITTEVAEALGVPIAEALDIFVQDVEQCNRLVGHNLGFDNNIVGAELLRLGRNNVLEGKKVLDTIDSGTDYCKLPGGKGGGYKYPTLTELHHTLFQKPFSAAHNAVADVEATAKCFFKLAHLGEVKEESFALRTDINEHLEQAATEILKDIIDFFDYQKEKSATRFTSTDSSIDLEQVPFAHLHAHSQFSVLQSTIEVKRLVKMADKMNMPAVALTDFGNMYGIFDFVKEGWNTVQKDEQGNTLKDANGNPLLKVKPVVGCEFYLAKDMHDKSFKEEGITQVLLAKNERGYRNLARLCSSGFTEGFYYTPRIDKKLLLEYKQDLIALSGGLSGEIPYLLLNVGKRQAEEALLWWKENFGDDFYLEICRHGRPEEEVVNSALLELAAKHSVKYVAANDVRYDEKSDMEALDIMLCIKENEKVSTPIGKGRAYRMGFENDQYYFKSPEEMKALFADIPQAIVNTGEIVDKIVPYKLERDILLPKFEIPAQFEISDNPIKNQGEYLKHLTYEGAKKRYEEITPEIQERIDFELETIISQGYPGYFLIVQDFTNKAKDLGVSVGPGRGSAAGSVVAYCNNITNVDPIRYDLLFERFLNPERVSMPDIDIDFDDVGREKVINYVIEKYGQNQVAHIITYGTMAAKSAVKNAARVMEVPLDESDRISKLFEGLNVQDIFRHENTAAFIEAQKEKPAPEVIQNFEELKKIAGNTDVNAKVLRYASKLEGSLRNTGIHACGIIITPEDIRNYLPVANAKDSQLFATQFENNAMESSGLLKMDFLGLTTLTIINDALRMIKENKGIDIDMDAVSLEDKKTYELLQRGETIGIFQFESPGMQKYMRELKPDKFDDLIAMNALYRPGPLAYIPNFIDRKHGREPITYDLPEMEEYLQSTYGITVYQEQVMLLSQKLAGFSKGQADVLRKAMGKKQKSVLDKMKGQFIEGGKGNGYAEDRLEKIWTDWEAFAAYAFNKSHSTCYALIAYHTAYLKANYPAEFMAAILISQGDIDSVKFYMEECRRMQVSVLGPDVNESDLNFGVNKSEQIRFGLSPVKGVGGVAAEEIVNERKNNGPYLSIFDLTSRINLRSVNKRVMEALAYAGAFDSLGQVHRAQYFFVEPGKQFPVIEQAIRYGNALQESKNSAQASLFGGGSEVTFSEPRIPVCEPWALIDQLEREKEVLGLYITGHPLDMFKEVALHFGTISSNLLNTTEWGPKHSGREFFLPCVVTDEQHKISRNGNPFGSFTVMDYKGSFNFSLFDEDYLRLKSSLTRNLAVMLRIKVRERRIPPRVPDDKPQITYFLKVEKADLLSKIPEMMVSEVMLFMRPDHLADQAIRQALLKLKSPKGHQVKVILEDKKNNLRSSLSTSTLRILPDNDTIIALKQLEINYQINRNRQGE